jgi:hypothetical protein
MLHFFVAGVMPLMCPYMPLAIFSNSARVISCRCMSCHVSQEYASSSHEW